MRKILVTGGAGYIGSHVVKALGDKGYSVLVFDNLSKGYRDAVLYGKLVVGDLADENLLECTVKDFRPDAVMHFAAFIEVGESVQDPIKYYLNNAENTIRLLNVIAKNQVNKFIFSSSAAVYGKPEKVPITEDEKINPINPYGQSKVMIETVLRDLSAAMDFRHVSLRYFNAAGADPEGRIGERHNPESHLIPLILKAVKGERQSIKVYGTDYPTPDGTCIRDYIHIEDLADAHLLALNYLIDGGKSDYFNCGYGRGYSVQEVIKTVKKLTGISFEVQMTGRRSGDPPVLVADSSKLKKQLHWKPRYDSLEYIIKTAWEWEKKQR